MFMEHIGKSTLESCLTKFTRLIFENVLHYITCTFVYRSHKSRNTNIFTFEVPQRTTRRSEMTFLHVPFTNLDFCRHGIMIRGPREYNALPLNIRNKTSCNFFKAIFKRQLLSFANNDTSYYYKCSLTFVM